MKKQDIEKMTDSIDEKYIEEAADYSVKAHTPRRKLLSIAAACILVLCITVPTVLYATAPESESSFGSSVESSFNEDDFSFPEIIETEELGNIALYANRYSDSFTTQDEDYSYPWTEMTDSELYRKLVYNGKEYATHSSPINESNVGRSLGVYGFSGTDEIDDTIHTAEFEIFEIDGVSSEYCVAAKMDYGFYPCASATPIETLGDCINALNLYQNIPLTDFYVYENVNGDRPYLRINDPTQVWKILLRCGDAKYNKELSESMDWWQDGRKYITFSTRSRKLGLSGAISVSRDGKLKTSLFGYARIYDIGVENANAIIDYALNNSSPTKRIPYNYWICGYIKEISEDHILIDDTLLCENGIDGIVYKLDNNNKIVKRGVKYESLKIGDLAVVSIDPYGYVDENDQNAVHGINWISRGYLFEGDIVVLE